MPEKPQKFVVSLAVNVAVFADDEFEARKEAQGWLQKNVRHDSTVEVNLVIPHEPKVPSARSGHEGMPASSNWAAQDNAEISAERSRPGYIELIDRLARAETTDDYLRIRQDVLAWKPEGAGPVGTHRPQQMGSKRDSRLSRLQALTRAALPLLVFRAGMQSLKEPPASMSISINGTVALSKGPKKL